MLSSAWSSRDPREPGERELDPPYSRPFGVVVEQVGDRRGQVVRGERGATARARVVASGHPPTRAAAEPTNAEMPPNRSLCTTYAAHTSGCIPLAYGFVRASCIASPTAALRAHTFDRAAPHALFVQVSLDGEGCHDAPTHKSISVPYRPHVRRSLTVTTHIWRMCAPPEPHQFPL